MFIVACLSVAIIAALAITFTATPMYKSTARLFVSTPSEADPTSNYTNSLFSQTRVTSYADLATGPAVMEKVIQKLGLTLTPSELASRITAEPIANTVILSISATDTSPKRAQQLAQTEADELRTFVTALETHNGATTSAISLAVADPASFEAGAVSPKVPLTLGVAILLGLLIGISGAFLRDILDTTIKGQDEAQHAANAPVLASVGFNSAIPRTPLISDEPAGSDRSEAFRVLRTNLQFIDLDTEPTAFVVTSALPGEGKTMTATNIAIALAQAGRRVLLVDCDLRRPRVAEILGLENRVGLTTVLVGRISLEESVQVHKSGVHFLATGPQPPNPAEILQSHAMADLLAQFRNEYEVVILDTPPLLPVADAAILSAVADGAMLVVRHGKTKIDQVHQASSRLDAVGARLFGVVVNMTPKRGNTYSYSTGNYNYVTTELSRKLKPAK
jgi:capsular exopolysaccharide synthesis family protein